MGSISFILRSSTCKPLQWYICNSHSTCRFCRICTRHNSFRTLRLRSCILEDEKEALFSGTQSLKQLITDWTG